MSATPAATSAASASATYDSAASQASASDAAQSLSSLMASASAALASESQAATGEPANPPAFKYIGIALAILSGILIGGSFVFKKKGLLRAQQKYATVAGEGYAYLKSPMWWTGMITMILGEVFNFVAYAFAPAILVTPFGALAVVVSAILSSFFLQEKLTLFGKIGCFLCINGSVIIALNGPSSHSGGAIEEFKHLFLAPGFLVWAGICIVVSLVLIFFVAPKFGKKNMLVYITICSLLGGLSVSTTSGLGSAILLTIRGSMQLKNWFFYVLLVFVVITLVAEIIYLNKALELFHTSMVTAVYYTTFTSATLVSTIILFKGLDAAPTTIVTLVLGFLTIVTGIVLLQLSKVDPEELDASKTPGIDRSTTLLMRASRSMISVRSEKGAASTAVEDPGIDTMRGAGGLIGSIVRARSSRRVHASADEYAKMDEHGMSHLNTGRRADLERFQLHDAPMDREGSMLSGRSAGGTLSPASATMPNMPKRGPSMVSFTEESLGPHGHHHYGPGGSLNPTSPTHASGGGILSPPQKYGGFLGTSDSSGRQLSDIKESQEGASTPYDEEKGGSLSAPPRDPRYNSTLSGISYDDDSSMATPRVSSSQQANVRSTGLAHGEIPRAQHDLRHMFDPSTTGGGNDADGHSPYGMGLTIDGEGPGMYSGSPEAVERRDPFGDSNLDLNLSTMDSLDSIASSSGVGDSNAAQTRQNKKKYPQGKRGRSVGGGGGGDRSHHGVDNDDGDGDEEAEELLSPKFR